MECTPWVYSFGERFSANLWKRQGKGWFVTTIPSQWFKQRGRLLSRITYHCWLVYLNFLSFCVFFFSIVVEEEDELTSSSAAGGVLLDDNWADAMTTFYFNMKYNLHLTSTNFARTRSAVKKNGAFTAAVRFEPAIACGRCGMLAHKPEDCHLENNRGISINANCWD